MEKRREKVVDIVHRLDPMHRVQRHMLCRAVCAKVVGTLLEENRANIFGKLEASEDKDAVEIAAGGAEGRYTRGVVAADEKKML